MIFVPMLHYLQNKNSFSGNEDGMRYLLSPGKRSVPDPDGGEGAQKGRYFAVFTGVNVLFLAVMLFLAAIL